MNHFRQQNGLADPRAPEESRLPAALERHENVNGLDAGLEYLGLSHPLIQRGRRSMNGSWLHVLKWGTSVDRVAEHVEHPGPDAFSHRDLQWLARIND